MKILWFLNSPIGISAKYLINKQSQSGTWIDCSYENLKNNFSDKDILYIASYNCPQKKIKINDNLCIIGLGEKAYIGKKINNYKNSEKLIKEFNPDIIQIWGSEFSFGLNIINIAKILKIPVLIYIQGVMQAISEFNYGGINLYNLFIHSGILAIPKVIKFYQERQNNKKQKEIEVNIISKSNGYICDNNWAKFYYNNYNNCSYFDINKVNNVFLCNKWKNNTNSKKTIMTVAGTKPEKGLHKLIEALIYLKKYYPNIELLIPGNMRFGIKENPYVSYLKWLINKHQLNENVKFLGQLNSSEICKYLLNSDLFVNPSYIENISTSLRESMYLGMPCISSMSGSVYELINHNYNGILYRYEETTILTQEILEIFANKNKAEYLGNNAYNSIRNKFPQNINENTLYNIYQQVILNNKNGNK